MCSEQPLSDQAFERLSETEFARLQRKGTTRSEYALWEQLRKRRLDGFRFTFQSPIDKYFADFCCRSHRLVLEVDGASHSDRQAKDVERDHALRELGYEVLRFTDDEVLNDMPRVLMRIRDALEKRPLFRY